MDGTLIYNKADNTLTSIDLSGSHQFESQVKTVNLVGQFSEIEFSDFAKSKENYDPLMGQVLRNSKYYDELQTELQLSLEDSGYVGICDLDIETGNRIYLTDGKIWNWNFYFLVIGENDEV